MTPRERTQAIILLGLILFGGGGAAGYMLLYTPYQEKKAAAAKLDEEINQLQEKVDAVGPNKKKLDEIKRQSLPADENLARAQYKLFLEQLLRNAGINDYKIPASTKLTARAPVVPELAPKKFAYAQLEFKVDASNVNLWQLVDFLRAFYQAELLHQITYINVNRTNKPSETRSGLEVHMTIEAVILDGAENRKTLFAPSPPVSVPNAVAAVGGIPGLAVVNLKSDLARASVRNTPGQPTPVLSTRQRDYSYVAWKDIFYGVLPDYKPPKVPSFDMGPIRDVVLNGDAATGEVKPGEARVRISGEGSEGAKVTAAATGKLIPEGDLKVDPKTHTITIPSVNLEEVSESATSTVTVVAVAGDNSGNTVKKSFKVSLYVQKTKSDDGPKPDISTAIKLPIMAGRSDGTRKAVIFDAAGPSKFEIIAEEKTIEVVKFWQHAIGKPWKKDFGYNQPPGVLQFVDDFSSTKRTFRVVAFEEEALILSESRSEAPKDAPKEEPKKGGFPMPKGGGARPVATKQGPADPLAAVAGNVAVSNPAPTFYRWTLGKSLKDLERLTPEEGKAIQKKVAAHGPIMASAVSTGN